MIGCRHAYQLWDKFHAHFHSDTQNIANCAPNCTIQRKSFFILLAELKTLHYTLNILWQSETVSLSHNLALHVNTWSLTFPLYKRCFNKSLVVTHILSLNQCANIFTKSRSPLQFTTLRDKLKVVDKFSLIQPSQACRGDVRVVPYLLLYQLVQLFTAVSVMRTQS